MRVRSCVLVMVLSFSVAGSARGQDARAPSAGTEKRAAASTEERYLELVGLGVRATVRRDVAGALAHLREAAALEPERAAAFCHMGDAQRVGGDLVEAVLAYESCSRFADAQGDARTADRGRAGKAQTLERVPARLGEARSLYSRLLTDAKEEAVVALAEDRLRALDTRTKLDTSYAAVRARIAARQKK